MSDAESTSAGFEALDRLLDRLCRRIRLQRGLDGLAEGCCVALMLAAVGVAATRTGFVDPRWWWMWALAAGLTALVGAAIRAARPVDSLETARRIDRTHGFHDRISTALALARRDGPGGDESLRRAQLRDAIECLDDVEPSRVAPWRLPRDAGLVGLLAGAVLAVGLFPLPDHTGEPPDELEIEHGPVLDDATLAFERERLERWRDADPDGADAPVADQIEALLNAAAQREISAREFHDRVDELLDELADQPAGADETIRVVAEAAELFTDRHAETLEDHQRLKDALDPMVRGDLEDGADRLEDLSRDLADDPPEPQQARQLADTLEDFADTIDERARRLDDHRDDPGTGDPETRDRTGDDRDADGADGSDGERPDRADEKSDTERQLERLSNDFRDSADQLRDDPDDFEAPDRPDSDSPDGADDTTRDRERDQQRRDDPEPDRQRQQQHGESSGDRSDSDRDDAQPRQPDRSNRRGDDGRTDETAGGGDRSERRAGDGTGDDRGDGRDEPDYRDDSSGLGEAADRMRDTERRQRRQQQRQSAREQLEDLRDSAARGDGGDRERADMMEDYLDRAGPDGEPTDRRPRDDRPGDTDGPGDEPDDPDGSGDRQFGAGDDGPSPDEDFSHDEQELDFDYTDEHLEGIEGRDGPTRSEVVESAAREGFATTEYEKVYADYEDIVEEVVERQQVPEGYRHYIEQYFELIRPRD